MKGVCVWSFNFTINLSVLQNFILHHWYLKVTGGSSWPWSYCSGIYNYLYAISTYYLFSYIVAVSFIDGGNWRGPSEKHRPVTSRWQTLSHNVGHWSRFELTSVVIGSRYWWHIGSCKSHYNTIMATTTLL
jgi:hypothetical protein